MKRFVMVSVLFLSLAGLITGCFTSATAHTRRVTAKDGVVTVESDVRIIGTGDKASQVAADGMFADGTDNDLGAGVKKASAAQESTGIEGTLKGMGSLMSGLSQLMLTAKGFNTGGSQVAQQAEADTSGAATAVSTATAASALSASAPKTINGGTNSIKIVILGNRATCGYCKRLWSAIDPGALSSDLCGATVIDADLTDNPSAYAELRPTGAFQWPCVLVYDESGKLAGQFVARGYAQDAFESKVRELVPSCSASASK